MQNYVCTVPLEYINTINTNKYEYEHRYTLAIEPHTIYKFSRNIEKINFQAEEVIEINIFSNENKLYLKISKIYANDKSHCIQLLQELLETLLPSLTFKMNCFNDNKHSVQYKLTCDFAQIEMNESPYLRYEEYLSSSRQKNIKRDVLIIEDKVQLRVIQHIKLEDYYNVFNNYNNDLLIKQLIDCYARAMGATDYLSKYFNLFTIIETLETFYKKEVDEKVLSDIEIKELLDLLRGAKDNFKEVEISDNIIKRVEDTLNRITTNPRGKKLIIILNEILEIDYISVLGNKEEISTKFINSIVKQRNLLFHGKKLNVKDQENLKELVLYLFILCESIISKLINDK